MFSLRRAAFGAASSFSSALISPRPLISSSQVVLRQKLSASLSTSAFRLYSSEYPSDNNQNFGETQTSANTANFSTPSAREGENVRINRNGGSGNRNDRPFGPPVDLSPNSSIYVGNLVFDLTAEDIKREFSSFGEVRNVTIATDSRGLSKGFGYVEFATVEQAEAAIEAKNQTVLEGRRLIVNYQAKVKRNLTENPPSKTLFVGNLAFEMTDADLNKLFRDIRNVIDVRVAIDRRTGQPRGFAHADFISVEDAVAAKEILTDQEVYGRKLRVDFSSGIKGSPSAESQA